MTFFASFGKSTVFHSGVRVSTLFKVFLIAACFVSGTAGAVTAEDCSAQRDHVIERAIKDNLENISRNEGSTMPSKKENVASWRREVDDWTRDPRTIFSRVGGPAIAAETSRAEVQKRIKEDRSALAWSGLAELARPWRGYTVCLNEMRLAELEGRPMPGARQSQAPSPSAATPSASVQNPSPPGRSTSARSGREPGNSGSSGTGPSRLVDGVREFAISVACSQMPLDACTWLDAENYANLDATVKSQMRQRFCGTANLVAAKSMAQLNGESEFPNPECTTVLRRLKEM